MPCNQKEDLIIRYCDGELPEREVTAFEEHLKGCETCRTKVGLLKGLIIEATIHPKADSYDALPVIRQHLDKAKNKSYVRGFKHFYHDSRHILRPVLSAFAIIFVAILLWPLLSKGMTSLIDQRFSVNSPAASNQAANLSTGEDPSKVPQPLDNLDKKVLEFYRTTSTYDEIMSLGSGSQGSYSDISIDELPLEDEPFLTDADIEGFIAESFIMRITEDKYLSLSEDFVSVRPLPFVVVLEGKRIFWGTFIHPISSVMPPQNIPLIAIRMNTDKYRFWLRQMDKAESFDPQTLIEFFKNQNKLEAETIDEETPQKQEDQENQIKYEITNVKGSMELVNFNTPDNSLTKLPLPEGWRAEMREYKPVDDFSWKVDKNKAVLKLREFSLYYDAQLENIYFWGDKGITSGELALLGFYNEEPYPGLMLNHAIPIGTYSEKNSLLGKAYVYLLDCDNYPAAQSENKKDIPATSRMYYVVIPVEGENLAYHLSLPIPEGITPEDYYPFLEEILDLS